MITNRLADCAKLVIGFNEYVNEENNSREIVRDAGSIFVYLQKDLDELIALISEEANKAPGAPELSTVMRRYEALKWSSGDTTKAINSAIIVDKFLYQVKRNNGLINSMVEGRGRDTIRGLAVREEGYSAVFAVPSASKIAKCKKWHKDALDSLVVTPVEEMKAEMLQSVSNTRDIEDLVREMKALDMEIRVEGVPSPEKLETRKALENELFRLAEASGDRKGALKEAAKILFTNESYASDMGRKIGKDFGGITEEQERAMIAEGPMLIAAGAGSGKTKVLAGKVAYHAIDQGVPLSKIIAVAFNRKASAELRERIIRYGGPQMEGINSMTNFKTTHSFSISVVSDASRITKAPRKKLLTDDNEIKSYLEAAVMQVAMGSHKSDLEDVLESGSGTLPFPVEGYFDTSKADVNPLASKIEVFIRDAVSRMTYMARIHGQKRDPVERARLEEMINSDADILGRVARWTWDDSMPTEVKPLAMWDQGDKDAVNAYIEGKVGRSKTRATKALGGAGLPEGFKIASPVNIEQPRGMWFNLGISALAKRPDGIEGESGKPVRLVADMEHESLEGLVSYIGHKIASYISPMEALAEAVKEASKEEDEFGNPIPRTTQITYEMIQACVYGAYQHLKGEQNMMTFDDALVIASKVLIENPALLEKYKNRFSHIMVDEAQDLNKSQHLLFGLIAGHTNPATLQPFEEGGMNAEVLAFIGDDKQAIYEFRGAQPDEFISKSDMEGGGFKTMILNTNFRSGRAIVQAANNLIAFNEGQLAMTCNANPANDDGSISYQVGDIESGEAQMKACDEIAEIVEAQGLSKDEYVAGVICRTNKELATFALGLISKGIPFYAKKDLVNVPAMGALFAMAGIKSVRKDVNTTSILDLTKYTKNMFDVPFKLDKIFRENFSQLVARLKPSSPLDWFIQEGWDMIYTGNQAHRNERDCKPFSDILFKIRSFEGSNDEFMRLCRSGMFFPLKVKEPDDSDIEGEDEADIGSIGMVVNNIFSRYDNIEEALDFCSRIKEISRQSSAKELADRKDVVFLGTAHGWKGLEAENMWMVMDKDTFPHPKALQKPNGLEEERRLAYVALTRGKQGVNVITSLPKTKTDSKGNAKTIGGPSQFIQQACIKSAPGSEQIPMENLYEPVIEPEEDMENAFDFSDDPSFQKMASNIALLGLRL